MTRDERQLEIVKKWIAAKGQGTVEAVTGFGKTRTAFIAINYLKKIKPTVTVVIVVPTLYLKGQWEENLVQYNLQANCQVVVINTASTHLYECDLLIIDECHTTGAEGFQKVFDTVSYCYLLCLTATIIRADGKHLEILQHAPLIDKITFEEAIENGWVADFKIYNLTVDFTEDEGKKYKANDKLYSYYEHELGGRFEAFRNATTWLKSDDKEKSKLAYMFYNCIRTRCSLLYEAVNKIAVTREIIGTFSDAKAIVFCQSIAFATQIDDAIGKESIIYHSTLSKKQKAENLHRFHDGRNSVRVITSVKSMDAGVDIKGLSLGIIASGTSRSLQNTQRTGRVIRKEEGKTATIVNLYIRDTQEQKWVLARTKDIPNVKWITNINQIQ